MHRRRDRLELGGVLTALLLAIAAGYGAHLLFTALTFGWQGLGPGPSGHRPARSLRRAPRERAVDWMAQAGLGDVGLGEFAAAIALLALLGLVAGLVVFGGVLPAVLLAAFAASAPVATYRRRRSRRLDQARDAWPRLIDEIRILTGSAGRSVPQALFEVGRQGPVELRPAFAAAQREWLLSTDFARTLDVLKRRLADPTADATCETLLIAHELGGTDLDGRLEALADDRRHDAQGRKDALAKQAGVRFARRFVLIVPAGMALVGLSIGNGRAAYQSPLGQVIVVAALGMVVACWLWAGRIMRLPDEQRVFP